METKVQLSDVDRRLIERIDKLTNYHTDIDEDGYIDVSLILACLDDLETEYHRLDSEYDGFRESSKPCDINDSWEYYSTLVYRLQGKINKQYEFIKEKGLEEEYDEYNG